MKIGRCNISLVLRHRFEKEKQFDLTFTKWEIGVWFKRNKIVGRNNFGNPEEWRNNLVNSYMIGAEMLLFKVWVKWNFNGMIL